MPEVELAEARDLSCSLNTHCRACGNDGLCGKNKHKNNDMYMLHTDCSRALNARLNDGADYFYLCGRNGARVRQPSYRRTSKLGLCPNSGRIASRRMNATHLRGINIPSAKRLIVLRGGLAESRGEPRTRVHRSTF